MFVKVLVVLRGKVRKQEEEVVMLDNKEVAMPGKREVNHQEDKREDKPTLRKTRSLTRADEQHQREMEEKVKVPEEFVVFKLKLFNNSIFMFERLFKVNYYILLLLLNIIFFLLRSLSKFFLGHFKRRFQFADFLTHSFLFTF